MYASPAVSYMTDMTAVSAVSDTPPDETPSPIAPVRHVSARFLARNLAPILREVADDGHSFVITHFGRVAAFLVPVDGRVPVKRGGHLVYEIPKPEPLLELNEVEKSIVGTLYRSGKAVPDRLIGGHDVGAVMSALGKLEFTNPPLLVRDWGSYDLTPTGVRHAEELGL